MTGIELIAKERQHQIDKHGFTGEHHANHPEWYDDNQMIDAASLLVEPDISGNVWYPKNWDSHWFYDLCRRSHKERLIIAGALIASEIDRLNNLENEQHN
ncbi:hypothetical protein SAMN05444682_115115 [Parapedobacter indicus]|uniref:Uncharacterized protein n=2 Tax=Parapedobacter indicus TaxID=1477437 RepID=A0A1I3UZL0_9SPHI|nr:hypothetical protein CLV26_11563 [Parapedobacter indicus]SFJ88119.1 hypothetical protein SAMN05444682_115115 [Parapedobacter indicus]